MKRLCILLPCVAAVLLAACEKEVVMETAQPLWKPVELSLQGQIQAMNEENLPAFMSYIHPGNPDYSTTESATRQLFKDYELRNGLEKIESVTLTDGEAKVKFVQLTQKIAGPEFRDNRVSGVHTLRKDNGVWKILSTEANGVVYLDEAK